MTLTRNPSATGSRSVTEPGCLPPATGADMTLLADPQRRNVIRMGGSYLVGSRLLVQVSSTDAAFP